MFRQKVAKAFQSPRPLALLALAPVLITLSVKQTHASGYYNIGMFLHAQGVVSIANATGTLGSNVVFTLSLPNAASVPCTVSWATSDGTALAGTNYTSSSGQATIAARTTSTTISVPTLSDTLDQSSTNFTVTLSSPQNCAIATATATGSIVDAVLDYNFMTATLDPTLRFSRAGPATFFNSSGVLTTSPANIITYSQQFNNAAWSPYQSTVTQNTSATTAPDGSTTAALLLDTTANGNHQIAQNSITYSVGTYLTFSVYVQAAGLTQLGLLVENTSNNNDCIWGIFNLSPATVSSTGTGGTGSNATGTITALTNGWYRVTLSGIPSTVYTTMSPVIQLMSGGMASYTGTGTNGVYLWGAQLEESSSASGYAATTSSANYVPRFDYDPVTHLARGLLMEGASTNQLTYSQALNNAAWTLSDITVTGNSAGTTAPDGSSTATLVAETTANGWHSIVQNVSGYASGANVCYSIFANQYGTEPIITVQLEDASTSSNDIAAQFNMSTGSVITSYSGGTGSGANGSMAYVGNGWYRLIVCGIPTTSNTALSAYVILSNGSYAGHTTNGVYLWGAQLEYGPIPTSYIPTTSAAVTRPTDNMTVANFSNYYTSAAWSVVAYFMRPFYEPTSASLYPSPWYMDNSSSPGGNSFYEEYETSGPTYFSSANSNGSWVGSSSTGSFATEANGSVHIVGTTLGSSVITQAEDGTVDTATSAITIPVGVNELAAGGDASDDSNQYMLQGDLRKLTYRQFTASTGQLTAYTSEFTVASITPNLGDAIGGGTLTVFGSGFQSGATVTIGNNACTGLTVVNSGELTCTIPGSVTALGPQNVVVTSGSNSQTLTNAYTYNRMVLVQNMLTYSEQLGNAVWGAYDTNMSVTANTTNTTAPDGSNDAALVAESTTNGAHAFGQTASGYAPGTSVCFSFFVAQYGTEPTVTFHVIETTAWANDISGTYNISSGTVTSTSNSGNGSGASASIVAYSNSWYRLILCGIPTTTSSYTTLLAQIGMGTYGTYAGNTSNGVYLWGAQLEEGSSASNYVTVAGSPSWTTPSNWNNATNQIQCIGGGGGGSNGSNHDDGGGGGAYSNSSNVTLTAGTGVSYQIGAGGLGTAPTGGTGGDSYFCNSTSSCGSIAGTGVVVGAKGGGGGSATGTGGAGGPTGTGVGTAAKYAGGAGGSNNASGPGGGGGAGGPNGTGGGGGGTGSSKTSGAGGGGGGGGSAGATPSSNTVGANGGNNYNSTGSGAGGNKAVGNPGTAGGGGGGGGSTTSTSSPFAGGVGGNGTDMGNGSIGSGGGGGSGSASGGSTSGGNGGLYGGGGGSGNGIQGGNGAPGVCVITYWP